MLISRAVRTARAMSVTFCKYVMSFFGSHVCQGRRRVDFSATHFCDRRNVWNGFLWVLCAIVEERKKEENNRETETRRCWK
jgi:hypothetical protein